MGTSATVLIDLADGSQGDLGLLRSLLHWLRAHQELRVESRSGPSAGHMGGASDMLMAFVDSAAATITLVSAITAWPHQRRGDVGVRITVSGQTTVLTKRRPAAILNLS